MLYATKHINARLDLDKLDELKRNANELQDLYKRKERLENRGKDTGQIGKEIQEVVNKIMELRKGI